MAWLCPSCRGAGPCLACVYPEPPSGAQPTCDVNGVLASTTASVASLQVALALRLIRRLAGFPLPHPDARCLGGHEQTDERRRPRPGLPRLCRGANFAYLDGQRREPVSLCGRNAVQLHESARPLNLEQLALQTASDRRRARKRVCAAHVRAKIRCDVFP